MKISVVHSYDKVEVDVLPITPINYGKTKNHPQGYPQIIARAKKAVKEEQEKEARGRTSVVEFDKPLAISEGVVIDTAVNELLKVIMPKEIYR